MLPFVPLANDDGALSHSPLLKAAVLTLEYIDEHGPIPLTPSKGLKRHFVHWAAQAFDWPGYTESDLFAVNKVLNEIDFPPLMVLHDILRGAKLARHYKGALYATKFGLEMRSQPGALWPLLAEFLLCRIDFCHQRQPDEQLLGNWDIFLNVLNVEAHDGASANQLCDILYGADDRDEGRNHRLSSPFYVQILRPLCWAGLLSQCEGDKRFGGDRQIVKTPLWTAALSLETGALVKKATCH
ncbi:MAG: hypothetical protein CVT75_00005 [Alphaproteobacteria bacterium HGW-Alphaproteobacteria-14]|nr:MAG: hypothetical protein CVT75_00005 [Alphaproteobacteria bacterium HGW-Alphaproteobacteria-14]